MGKNSVITPKGWTKTIVRLGMGHHRGMRRIDREGKKHYGKCYNCLETELTLNHIFTCPAILNLLKISILPITIDLNEDNIKLIAKAVFDVHGHI